MLAARSKRVTKSVGIEVLTLERLGCGSVGGCVDEAYEALAGRGNAMGTTAIVNYAYEQIEQTRAERAS